MKKLFITLGLLVSNYVFSQLHIIKECDDMTDKCSYYPSERLVETDNSQTTGVGIQVSFAEKDGTINPRAIICQTYNIGNCVENNSLIIMFEDSTKIRLKSWNAFNCDGLAYFDVWPELVDKFYELKIIKLHFINGRTYDSFGSAVSKNNQTYFQKLVADCRKNSYIEK